MRWPIPVFVGLAVLLATAAKGGAQSPHDSCVVKPPSFTTTDANRLSCEELDKLWGTHALVYVRPNRRYPQCENRVTIPPARGDGSLAVFCEVRCQSQGASAAHSWFPCTGGMGGRTTSVYTCTNGVFCIRTLNVRAEAESCNSFHRQDGKYAIVWVRGGRACGEGDVSFIAR